MYNKETTWYVDDAGILRLQIDDETYGEGQINFNESIKIEVNVMPNNNFTKATLEVIIEYEGEIDSVTINGEKLEVVKNAEGKYVGSKDVSENGTYSIEVIAKDGSKNKSEIKVTELADNMEIWNKADMENFRDKVNSGASFVDKKVQVMDDIYLDCSETNQWVPINNFDGTLDGNNHSINGIYVNTSESKIGFFKILSQTSSIQNIKLENVNINGKSEVGGLAAYNYSKNIQNCSVSGNISGNTNVGGLVGVSEGLTSNILNCSVSADVTGDFTVGGVVALNKSVIKYCGKSGSTTARVTENDFSMVGGIVGELQRRLFIFLC